MNKFSRAVSANMFFFVANTMFFLIFTPLSIRVMGDEVYGLWTIMQALLLFSGVGAMGITTIVTKFTSEEVDSETAQVYYSRVITGGFIIVLLIALFIASMLMISRSLLIDNLNLSIGNRTPFWYSIFWIAISIFPQFLCRVPQGFLFGQLKTRDARIVELVTGMMLWIGAIIIAWLKVGIDALAIWIFANSLLTLLWYIQKMQKFTRFQWQIHLPTLNKMWHFSGWMVVQSLGSMLFQQFDRIVVGFALGPAIAGIYSVGTSVALRLSLLSGQVAEVMVPYASNKISTGDSQRLYENYRRLLYYTSLLVSLLSGVAIIWMNEILSIWISPAYAARYATEFQIFFLAYTFLAVSRVGQQTLNGIGEIKYTSLAYAIVSIIMISILFVLAQHFGFRGASIANLTVVVLLALNLKIYFVLEKQQGQRVKALTDMRWLFLPVLILVFVFLGLFNGFGNKLFGTLIICTWVGWTIYRDDNIRNNLLLYMKQGIKL
jgi:O-antigen/teichoic acid export membrane protein